jgi:hypothetical protein
VLLLVAGEPAAFEMLCQLSTGHLRDATRSSLDPVIELLGLMGPIVAAADEELANHLSKQGLPPFFALSWFITWFSHDLADFGEVCAGKRGRMTHSMCCHVDSSYPLCWSLHNAAATLNS